MEPVAANATPASPESAPHSALDIPQLSSLAKLLERQEIETQGYLSAGWHPPEGTDLDWMGDIAEEYLRARLPDFACPDCESYGRSRSMIAMHQPLMRDRGDDDYPDFAFIVEVRDSRGRWIAPEGETPMSSINPVCIYVEGRCGVMTDERRLYSEAALTEMLFTAAENWDALPPSVRGDIARRVGEIDAKEVDWRERTIRAAGSHGSVELGITTDARGGLILVDRS